MIAFLQSDRFVLVALQFLKVLIVSSKTSVVIKTFVFLSSSELVLIILFFVSIVFTSSMSIKLSFDLASLHAIMKVKERILKIVFFHVISYIVIK